MTEEKLSRYLGRRLQTIAARIAGDYPVEAVELRDMWAELVPDEAPGEVTPHQGSEWGSWIKTATPLKMLEVCLLKSGPMLAHDMFKTVLATGWGGARKNRRNSLGSALRTARRGKTILGDPDSGVVYLRGQTPPPNDRKSN